MIKFRKILRKTTRTFIKGERASEAVEMAVMFPILLLMVGFIIDQFITYDGKTSIVAAGNEAIRAAVIEETKEDGLKAAEEKLSQTLKASKLAWCTSKNTSSCTQWSENIETTDNKNTFEKDDSKNLMFLVDKGWCSGGYLTLAVRAHKSSLFPSFESFRKLATRGGAVYHTHTYMITARIESNEVCS